MPYNFEATFTQPLLAQLDAGGISDARSWANAITTNYLNTIKLGMPSGVAPVLPAPGLNPGGPPPPFTIGVVPFTTAEARRQPMYNVIHAYFAVKELKLQRGSIESTISTIKQLLRKVRATTARIKTINDQIKSVTAELAQLPTFLKDLDDGVKLFIKDQVNQIDNLLESIRTTEFAASMSSQDFNQLFASELRMMETLRSFSVTDKAGLARLSSFLVQQTRDSDRVLDSSRREALIKQHLTKRLTKAVKEVLTFVQIPLQPNLFIDYANNLERQSAKFNRFARAIRQIAFIERFIRPKLVRLKASMRDLRTNLHNKLQPKIIKLQNKLSAKVKTYNTKSEEGKRSGLFKRANKTVKRAKKSNSDQIAKQTARAKAGKSLIKRTVSIGTKITALTLAVQQEIPQLKSDLIRQRARVASLQNTVDDLDQARADGNSTKIELDKLSDYMEGNGLGPFYQLTAKLVVETGSSAKEVITLLERRRARYKNYGLEIETLGAEVAAAQGDVNTLFGGKARPKRTGVRLWLSERTASIKCLLERIVRWLKPKLAKIAAWLKKFVAQLESLIKNTLRKVGKALSNLALNLIPVPSASRDPISKKNARQAKARAAKEKLARIKSTTKKLASLAQATPALVALTANIAQGRFKLSENQSSITKLSNALYGYKRQGKSPAAQQQLVAEQGKFNSNFQSLMVIESIASTLVQTSSTLRGQARAEFDRALDSIKGVTTPISPAESRSVEAIRQFTKTPPRTLKELKQAGQVATSSVMQDISATNRLVDVEKRVLRTTRQLIQTILEDRNLKRRYQQALADGDTCGLFFSAYTELKKISAGLLKQQSLILMCMKALAKLVGQLINWIGRSVKKLVDSAIKALKAKLDKIHKGARKDAKHRAGKGLNLDGTIMSAVLGLSARALWTGATWTGPTGSTHTCSSIGGFAPKMRAKVEDGATGFVREMARGFQNQLRLMKGVVTPPPVTGIPPLQFVGYN